MSKQRAGDITGTLIQELVRVAVASLAFFVATHAAAAEPPVDWRSNLLRDHRLVGKIWDAREGRAATADELGAAMAKARFALLGETHDNPDHHLLQAWEIGTIRARQEHADKYRERPAGGTAAKGTGWTIYVVGTKSPIIALEMLSRDQGRDLQSFAEGRERRQVERTDKFFRDAPTGAVNLEELDKAYPLVEQAGDFASAVAWDKSGWPPFAIYRPLIEAALRTGRDLVLASPSRDETKAVSKNGLGATLGTAEVKRFALDTPLDRALADALATELKESHCGMLSDEALPHMSDVQRFRDATMADALGPNGEVGGILVAGNGHVRRDRGVPLYLERRGVKSDDIVSVMHIEVEDGMTDPAAYVPRAPDGTPTVDFIWFTPRQERADPCEGLRERLAKPPDGAK